MTKNRATKTLRRVHSIGGRDLGIPHHRIAKVKAVLGEAGEDALEGDSDESPLAAILNNQILVSTDLKKTSIEKETRV